MPNTCIYCGHGKGRDCKVSMFRFPASKERRQQWLAVLNLKEDDIVEHSRICSRHFLHGDSSGIPVLNLGRQFISPKKANTDRTKRSIKRTQSCFLSPHAKRLALTPSSHDSSVLSTATDPSSRASSVVSTATDPSSSCASSVVSTATDEDTSSQVMATESLFSDSSVQELRSDELDVSYESEISLAARVELLESQLKSISKCGEVKASRHYFRIEDISDSDARIKFYTGFSSYSVLLFFFEFLGPSVNQLKYWGDAERKTIRRRKSLKLDPLNQFFLTLVKLRLDLRVTDLGIRFGISASLVSKYFITWICFLYHYLKEVDWTPSVAQVSGTMPCVFKDKFPTTYSIIDASEIFIQTPSDLHVQSSSWSNYKHHNTAKVLIGCTPNGAVSFVSSLFFGSISDIELTRASGYLETLDDKVGVSVMADRGFTIKEMLAVKGVDLNIPPFMDGRKQLTVEEVAQGRRIAAVRIHILDV